MPSSVPYPILVWRFGPDLTLVALSGEVCVDYALRLKRELGPERTWVAGYANQVPCYIPSDRVLAEGGYEAGWGPRVGPRRGLGFDHDLRVARSLRARTRRPHRLGGSGPGRNTETSGR